MNRSARGATEQHDARLRERVRAFVAETERNGLLTSAIDGWFFGFSPEFSKAMAAQGWIGMTWPARYGGGERTARERFIVMEELLAAGAPMNAHWVADRQTGPSILKYGTEAQKRTYLPRMAAGELYSALGMSEPDSGSDLASVRTTARRVTGGWRISGTKIWTGNAHRAHIAVVLCRSSDDPDRNRALSQFIVPLDAHGVTARPIVTLTGKPHFCELTLDDVLVGDDALLGDEGAGWEQVVAELALERGGPERVLSTFPLLERLIASAASSLPRDADREIGALVTKCTALRSIALSLLGDLTPTRQAADAAAFKAMGTAFESELTDVVRRLIDEADLRDSRLDELYREAVLVAPAASLRGGTTEIMHGIAAKAL